MENVVVIWSQKWHSKNLAKSLTKPPTNPSNPRGPEFSKNRQKFSKLDFFGFFAPKKSRKYLKLTSSAAELFSLRYFLDFLNSKNPKKSSFVFPWVMMFVRSFECPQSSINLNMHISFECQFSIRFFDTFSTLSSFQNRIRVSLSSISFGQRVSKEEGGEDHILAFVALLRCRFLFVISRLVYNNETLILDFEILFRLKKMR